MAFISRSTPGHEQRRHFFGLHLTTFPGHEQRRHFFGLHLAIHPRTRATEVLFWPSSRDPPRSRATEALFWPSSRDPSPVTNSGGTFLAFISRSTPGHEQRRYFFGLHLAIHPRSRAAKALFWPSYRDPSPDTSNGGTFLAFISRSTPGHEQRRHFFGLHLAIHPRTRATEALFWPSPRDPSPVTNSGGTFLAFILRSSPVTSNGGTFLDFISRLSPDTSSQGPFLALAACYPLNSQRPANALSIQACFSKFVFMPSSKSAVSSSSHDWAILMPWRSSSAT